MKKMVTTLSVILMPFCLFGQLDYGQMINNFDATPADPNYWGYDASENSDSTLSFVNESYVSDPVSEGAGAMQLDYSAHNIEGWGGYAKIYHLYPNLPDDGTPALSGAWKLAPIAGALGVGPGPGDYSWWSNNEGDVTTRACLFDDEYVFNADGSFQNVLGSETWIEGWQGGDYNEDGTIDWQDEHCGSPIAPHDGTNPATWSVDETAGTITVSGLGAYLGLSKVHNSGEDGSPVDNTITYSYSLSADGNNMDVTISGFNGDAEWIFRFVKVQTSDPILSGTWKLAPIAGALGVGPGPGD
ncbi:uncharacterized protein METZ01_LOCUS321427, partial [marine metagenome]